MPYRSRSCRIALTFGALVACIATSSDAASCTREDFASVVDRSGQALRDLNSKNAPKFQARLRELKIKRDWDESAFLVNARPFVDDDQIAAYDEKSGQLLASINSLGGDEPSAPPDCALLDELTNQLNSLVAVMLAKWNYMFEKLEKALAEQ